MQVILCDNCKKEVKLLEVLFFGHTPIKVEPCTYLPTSGFLNHFEFCSYACAGGFIANDCKPVPIE